MAEVARAAVQAMAVATSEDSTRHEETQNARKKVGGPMMKQPTFNWKAEDKCSEH